MSELQNHNEINGYVLFPCFTVKVVDEDEVQMTCGSALEWIFENFLACFWNGEVVIPE